MLYALWLPEITIRQGQVGMLRKMGEITIRQPQGQDRD